MSDWYDSEMDWKWNLGNIWGKLTHPFTEFCYWMVKSIQYAWFLRKDFDWDYFYILLLLQYKLKRTRKRIIENDLVVRVEEIAAQIKHAEDLIQNWRDDNFCEDLHKAHEEKWGDTVDLSEPFLKNGRTYYTWNMSREKATTPELREQERKEQRVIYSAHEKAKQECWNDIWNQIKEYGQWWWD